MIKLVSTYSVAKMFFVYAYVCMIIRTHIPWITEELCAVWYSINFGQKFYGKMTQVRIENNLLVSEFKALNLIS